MIAHRLADCPWCQQIHQRHAAHGPSQLIDDDHLMRRARQLVTLPPGERGPAMEALARSYGVTRRTLQRYLAK